jgi:protein-S-isoprenylcysteine O-methyltransferase Ste14
LCGALGLGYDARVIVLDWLAAAVLFLHWPIPLYWLVVHPRVDYWRRHVRAAYVLGLLISWPPVTAGILLFRGDLFRTSPIVPLAVVAGLTLIAAEIWILIRVHSALGTARLVGTTELSGGGEVARAGIYARMRHPRYTGSFLAVAGACLVAGSRAMWIASAVWLALMRLAIHFEENELRGRFRTDYQQYAKDVPRFFPRIKD